MLDREHVTDAIKFWERGRLLYNAALAALSLTILLFSKVELSSLVQMAVPLFLLAVIANLLFCAAYPVDLLVQASDFRGVWRDARWALLALGTATAAGFVYLILGGPYVFNFPGETPHG